jgi:hypothetical protein
MCGQIKLAVDEQEEAAAKLLLFEQIKKRRVRRDGRGCLRFYLEHKSQSSRTEAVVWPGNQRVLDATLDNHGKPT